MPKTVIINGSPKPKESASKMLIEKIQEFLENKPTIYHASGLVRQEDYSEELSNILNSDILLFVFPLYVDSLPAPLIKLLTIIEQERALIEEKTSMGEQKGIDINRKLPIIYAITNCGFFEAEHNQIALDIIKNFSSSVGMRWGYGIGIGGGGYIASNSKHISKKGSASNVYNAFCELGGAMENNIEKKENVFLTPTMPRFLYKFSGNLSWYLMAIKNGSLTSLKAKPHTSKS